ncbi:MAG: hypothetical protein DMG69_26960 [Acidobacteria bacterium]|nr:MAG: hypothetical protein DMG69_26960 [Acidobacteriota bacterium]
MRSRPGPEQIPDPAFDFSGGKNVRLASQRNSSRRFRMSVPQHFTYSLQCSQSGRASLTKFNRKQNQRLQRTIHLISPFGGEQPGEQGAKFCPGSVGSGTRMGGAAL